MTQYAKQSIFNSAGRFVAPQDDFPAEGYIEDDTLVNEQPAKSEHYNGTRVYKQARKLGRKYETQDVQADPRLRATAEWFVNEVYKGDFGFMIDMAHALNRYGSLTPGQAKGVLNVMVNEFQRHLDKREQQPPTKPQNFIQLPNGYYTVSRPDGSHVTFRLKADTHNGAPVQKVGVLVGSDNVGDYANFANISTQGVSYWRNAYAYGRGALTVQDSWKEALEALLTGALDAQQAGEMYAQRSGKCYVCGRLLTDPVSIELGIGPVCRAKGIW